MTTPAEIEADATTVAAIAEALRAFAKALRANQLYLPNNPTRQRALEIAQTLFQQVWLYADPITLAIRETELLWRDHVVYRDAERGTDGLPFLLYRDGLRELQVRTGFETDELAELLALLQRARTAQPDEDDLVTLLWVGDFTFVRYRHVETGTDAELPLMLAGSDGIATFSTTGPQLATANEEAPPLEGPPPGFVRLEDFDTTLYFLDRRELQYLNDEVRREYGTDGKRDVISILFDILETQTAERTIDEVAGYLGALLTEFIAAAEYDDVAYLLREARVTIGRARGLPPSAREALSALSDRLSEPSVMSQILQALEEGTRAPSPAVLDSLFAELRRTALPTLVAWLAGAPASAMQAAVERAAAGLAASHTGELVKLLEGSDDDTIRGAVRLAARLKSPATVNGLGRVVVRSTDHALRADAVNALGETGSVSGMQYVERAIDDAAREVRVAAFRAIANNRYTNALPKLAAAMRKRDLRSADLTEKVALFEAYGTLCGDEGVPALESVLNGRTLLSFREPPDLRACAARALGLVATPAATDVLRAAIETKDVIVRTAVQRALRGNA